MILENTKKFIDYFKDKNFTKEQVLKILEERQDLTTGEKNFIYLYCFPRPLLDRELIPRVMEEHKRRGDDGNCGSLEPNELDITLILEAGQTEQYGRFIKHLMYAFCDESKIYKVYNNNVYECPICGKKLSGESLWKVVQFQDPQKEFLAIGSKESSITMCLDCLVQLNSAKEVIDFIDPSYLDWTKRLKK